jgi:hypothetical protein
MASNCSLIKPQSFQFNAVGCDSTQINRKCSNNGQSSIIFNIDMPTGSNAATAKISLTNTRTNENYNHFVSVSEYKCSCSTVCIEDIGLKKNNKYTIAVLFDDLIPGDRYSGTACLEYIDSASVSTPTITPTITPTPSNTPTVTPTMTMTPTTTPSCQTGLSWTVFNNPDNTRGNRIFTNKNGNVFFLFDSGGGFGTKYYRSSDYGISWSAINPPAGQPGHITDMDSSYDGNIVFMTTRFDSYKSTNAGLSWSKINDLEVSDSGQFWANLAVSDDGSKIIVCGNVQPSTSKRIKYSSDGGNNFNYLSFSSPYAFTSVAMSSDGSVIAMTSSENYIFISLDIYICKNFYECI